MIVLTKGGGSGDGDNERRIGKEGGRGKREGMVISLLIDGI